MNFSQSNTYVETFAEAQTWRLALDQAKDQLGFPVEGESVAIIGCGTSNYIAFSYAQTRENKKLGITDSFIGSEVPLDRHYDRYIFISRSGATTEILNQMRRLRALSPAPIIVGITCACDSQMKKYADYMIEIPVADDISVVQTRSATSVLLVLLEHMGEEVRSLIAPAQAVLDNPLPDELMHASQWTFLGQNGDYGLAMEAALKLRETCQLWCEAYNSMEYRHGPISIAESGRAVWALGRLPTGLAEEITATGAFLYQSGQHPIIDLVAVHKLALMLAERRGLNPDSPRNLTRAVVLY